MRKLVPIWGVHVGGLTCRSRHVCCCGQLVSTSRWARKLVNAASSSIETDSLAIERKRAIVALGTIARSHVNC